MAFGAFQFGRTEKSSFSLNHCFPRLMNFRTSCTFSIAFQTRTRFRLPCTQIAVMWANNFDKMCSFEEKHFQLTRTCTVVGLFAAVVVGALVLGTWPAPAGLEAHPHGGAWEGSGLPPVFWARLCVTCVTTRPSFSLGSRGEESKSHPRFWIPPFHI